MQLEQALWAQVDVLGAAEAGFFPAILFYASIWFPAEWRCRAVSRFYVAQPVSQIIMGLVSAPILNLDGILGLHGWQWLFVIEGIPSVLLGLALLRLLPDAWFDRALQGRARKHRHSGF